MAEIYNAMARECASIALKAAIPILDIYHRSIESTLKPDGSPVTAADIAADQLICQALRSRWPDIPIISEEGAHEINHGAERFFLVDPLDGTREFLNRTGEFTVNIALIENRRSVVGVIYAPIKNTLFIGGEHAYSCPAIGPDDVLDRHPFNKIQTRKVDRKQLIALGSLSHGNVNTDAFFRAQNPADIRKSGSSLKFCLIAQGDADFYPRFGPTMGWDVAAGHAILRAAGGTVLAANGHELHYDSEALENGPFLAAGNYEIADWLRANFIQHVRNQDPI